MNRFIKIKVPFATKSYIKKINKNIIMKGLAYYIFDLCLPYPNQMIDEYIQIEKTNFRPTDYNMLETNYYQKKDIKRYRGTILDKICVNFENKISNICYPQLNKKEIKKINEIFKHKWKTTIRTMYSLLSGSNPSGAETNNKASPIRCIDCEFFNCNFANVFKTYEAKKNHKTKIAIDEDIKEYTLKDIINSNIIKNFKNIFLEYNPNHEINKTFNYDEFLNNFKDESYENNISKQLDKWKNKESHDLFIHSIINKTIYNYKKDKDFYRNIKIKLRSYYQANINYCLKNNLLPYCSSIQKIDLNFVENAHILSFSELLNKNTYQSLSDAINPFNCLRIDKLTHTQFDKNIISFDKYGNKIGLNGEIIPWLEMKNMPEISKNFFERYLKKKNIKI